MLLIKYYLYYLIGHYHLIELHKCVEKTKTYLNNDKMFRKYVKKFMKHSVYFDRWQGRLDILKRKIENKYGI